MGTPHGRGVVGVVPAVMVTARWIMASMAMFSDVFGSCFRVVCSGKVCRKYVRELFSGRLFRKVLGYVPGKDSI